MKSICRLTRRQNGKQRKNRKRRHSPCYGSTPPNRKLLPCDRKPLGLRRFSFEKILQSRICLCYFTNINIHIRQITNKSQTIPTPIRIFLISLTLTGEVSFPVFLLIIVAIKHINRQHNVTRSEICVCDIALSPLM